MPFRGSGIADSAVRLNELPEPIYFAHRGLTNVFPENTKEAFEGTSSLAGRPAIALETDVRDLLDGGLGLMHDSTVDARTTSTGDVSSFTTPKWSSLIVDAGSWFLAGGPYGNLTPATLDYLLRAFGGRRLISPEAKTTRAGELMAELIEQFGLTESVLPNGFTNAGLSPLQAVGCQTAFIDGAAAISAATILADGHSWVFVDRALAPQANVTAFLNAGLKVAVYNITRHVDRDVWLGLGVNGFVSDDAYYLSASATDAPHRSAADPFANVAFWHGQLSDQTSRGVFKGTDRWGFDSTVANTIEGALWGWASPTPSAAVTIDVTFTFDNVQDAARHCWIYVALDDGIFRDAAGFRRNGYMARIQADGTMRLHRVNVDGTVVQIGANTATIPITAGNTALMRLTITASAITWERLDTLPASITSSGADAIAHRPASNKGWYVHGGRSGPTQEVSFSNVAIA